MEQRGGTTEDIDVEYYDKYVTLLYGELTFMYEI